MLSRLIWGSRQSLLIGVVSTVLGVVVGMLLGVLAGAFGGKVDTVVMRFVDIMLSIPSLLMAISISVLLGQNQYVADDRHRGHPGADLRPPAARLDARAAGQ